MFKGIYNVYYVYYAYLQFTDVKIIQTVRKNQAHLLY